MSNNKAKYTIISHRNCFDGRLAAWVAYQALKRETDDILFSEVQYNDPLPPENYIKGRGVFIVDFSYPVDDLRKLCETAQHVTWIDHHESAIKDHAKNHYDHPRLTTRLSIQHSGAVLTWRYFNEDAELPKLLMYAEDYDLWHHKHLETKAIVRGACACDTFTGRLPEFFQWVDVVNQDDDFLSNLMALGNIVLETEASIYDPLVKDAGANPITFMDHQVMVVNSPSKLRDVVCEALYTKHPEIDFVMSYSIRTNKYTNKLTTVFSLRSAKGHGTNVSLIAGRFKGGGHVNSSAFSINHANLTQFFARHQRDYWKRLPGWLQTTIETISRIGTTVRQKWG